MKTRNDFRAQALGKFALFGGLLAALYHSSYAWLFQKDWPREDYNYCYLIPLVVLYLIWEKKDELAAEPAVPSWGGLLLLVPGLLLFWVGDLAGELYSLYFSSWFAAVGILWMQIGWRKLKVILFPLFIALSMFPLPNFLNTKLTFGLRLISSKIGVALIQLYGVSAYREGNVIDLGFTQLQVVDACSGLRYLFPLLIMGVLLSYFYKAALWKKVLLVVSTVPLTIIINSLRIAATGILFRVWGPAVAEGFFHGFSGWLIFMFALAVLLVEMWVLKYVGGPPRSKPEVKKPEVGSQRPEVRRDATMLRLKNATTQRPLHPDNAINAERDASSEALLHRNSPGSLRRFFQPLTSDLGRLISDLRSLLPPQFVVAVIMLAGALALAQGVEFREKIPASKPFSQFPLTVGAWEGTRQSMEQKFITELDLSDYAIVDYVGSHGKGVNFYVAYYETQQKGESIHSPETCLPGSGWAFEGAGRAAVDLANGRMPMPVNRAFMEKAGQRQLSYFWFPQRGRVLTNAYQLKLFTFWDALTRQRTDGALVRLITPIYEREEVADAEQRLQAFTRDIIPVLDQFIPGR